MAVSRGHPPPRGPALIVTISKKRRTLRISSADFSGMLTVCSASTCVERGGSRLRKVGIQRPTRTTTQMPGGLPPCGRAQDNSLTLTLQVRPRSGRGGQNPSLPTQILSNRPSNPKSPSPFSLGRKLPVGVMQPLHRAPWSRLLSET